MLGGKVRWSFDWRFAVSSTRSGLFDTTPLTCAECRDLMDVAAGLTLTGVSLEQGLPGFARHIATCANCREEYELLVYALRTAPGTALPLVSMIPLQTPSPAQAPLETNLTTAWVVPAQILAEQWFGHTGLTQACGDTDLPDRRLLFADAASTPWALAGLEVSAQRESQSSRRIELSVQVAFDQPVDKPFHITLRWADQTCTSMLDEQSRARFAGIAIDSLFDANVGQAKSDLQVLLAPAS